MKLETLDKIITEHAYQLKENAGYSGSSTDGGCDRLLNKLKSYREKWIYKMDLKPSEYNQLNEVEVGEPIEFATEIQEYKLKLATNIVKNMKL